MKINAFVALGGFVVNALDKIGFFKDEKLDLKKLVTLLVVLVFVQVVMTFFNVDLAHIEKLFEFSVGAIDEAS